MPWREATVVSERRDFVEAVRAGGAPIREHCRRYGISEPTGRKWRQRFDEEGPRGLEDRSRRPHQQPARTAPDLEAVVCETARQHLAWGPRKLRRWLADRGVEVPAPSTVQRILERCGVERLPAPSGPPARTRFVAPAPNALWQMDFKGHFALARGGRCHPFTVLDDHSRFNIVLASCADERRATVQQHLTAAFRTYGLPERILADNGAPWGHSAAYGQTRLSAWLIRLGVTIVHGRPYHPQTQGKEERFHRTLAWEVLDRRPAWADHHDVQCAFDAWRPVYNYERPHDSLDMRTPSAVYTPSARPYPETLPPVSYAAGAPVRKVRDHGEIQFRGRTHLVGRGFRGEWVALYPATDGAMDVYYCHQRVARIDLREGNDVSEH